MSESKLIKRFERGGRRPRPYGYSYLTKKATPEERLRIVRYVEAVRSGLIEDLGPREEDLTAAQILLIDRLISLLGVIRGIEEYHQEDIMNGDGSLKPALGRNYLAYVNSTRQILALLGLERRSEQVLTPLELAAEIDKEKERENPE